ncbi:MAG: hypothetical protein JO113_00645 [Candidatus Eremiobacteraeota bacterium]|nr:hypothetical protein [Candidatus Eremiobacteraeota bacterium]
MRIWLTLLAFGASTALIAACGGSQPNSMLPLSGPDILHSGRLSPNAISRNDLFVGVHLDVSGDTNEVEILQNGTFKEIGTVGPPGHPEPTASWVDSHGLYIGRYYYYGTSDYSSVIEYSSPTKVAFAYSKDISRPSAVTTDSQGNVYEADNNGWVNEYAQKKNVVKARCSLPGGPSTSTPYGVAVDNVGDVFVAYYNGSVGQIEEFSDLGTCFGFGLGVKLSHPGGMALDTHGNILVCEPYKNRVDIIKPPYDSISSHLGSGLKLPFDITINGSDNRVWVVDPTEIYDLYYPSGKVRAKIQGTNVTLLTAVDGSNYVP